MPVDIRPYDIVGIGRDPASVVDYAIGERERKQREARRMRDVNIAYDEVWCVVDVDDHTTLGQALTTARRKEINLVISAPCFELWLLYHFSFCADECDRDTIRHRLGRHIKDYDKHLPLDFPYYRFDKATRLAQRAAPDHNVPNRLSGNPSTNVWLVVESIRRSGRMGGGGTP